jgi:uncharacterized protein YbcI
MATDNRLEQRLSEAISKFLADQMSMTPSSVSVDVHPDSVVVTFRGATSRGERDCARDSQARERIERCYHDLFQVTAPPLEELVGGLVGLSIERSNLSLDVVSGDGVILFTCRG